jgi:large subunit ribosomal protein L2
MAVGDQLMNGPEAPIKPGNCLPIRNIPVGTTMHCVEMLPGKGAQIARTAGAGVVLMAREGIYAQVRLRSGEIRRVHIECRATLGEVGNEEHNLRQIGKAGATRWRGIRPTVRGVAMNPVDHPHGGGEGKTGEGRVPVNPWGQPTKGYRTRRNKRTTSMIVQRRFKIGDHILVILKVFCGVPRFGDSLCHIQSPRGSLPALLQLVCPSFVRTCRHRLTALRVIHHAE